MRVSAYILLLSLALPFLSKTAGIAKYLISYDAYLAACENIDRPEVQCNGTCQWAKEHAEKNHTPTPPIIPESLKVEIAVFQEKPFSFSFKSILKTIDVHPYAKLVLVEGNILDVPTPPPNVLI